MLGRRFRSPVLIPLVMKFIFEWLVFSPSLGGRLIPFGCERSIRRERCDEKQGANE